MQDLGALRARLLLESQEFKKGMNEAREEMKKTGTSAKEVNTKFSGLNSALKDVGLSSSQIDKINERIKKANPKLLEKDLSEVRKELEGLGLDSKEIDKITNEIDKASKSTHNFKEDMDKVQKASFVMAGTIAAGLGIAVKTAADFEEKMSAIKAVSGASNEEMKQLNKLAIDLGASTSFSASEAAQAIEELIKAGVTTKDIINGGLQGALDLAAAGTLGLADAAEIASTALNAFKDDNLAVAQAADILAGAANASATDVGELKYGLSMVSAVASGVGLSFQDTATALAVFAQNGLKGSDAGTSLKTMLLNLQPSTTAQYEQFYSLGLMVTEASKAMEVLKANGVKPLGTDSETLTRQLMELAAELSGTKVGSEKANKEYMKLASSTGVLHSAFYDANGSLKDMNEIAGILREALDGMGDAQRQAALRTMFGTDAIRAATIIYKEGAEGIETMWESMSKVTAAEVAKTKLDNLKGSIEEFRGGLETFGIQVGTQFLPVLKDIVDHGTNFLDVLNELDPRVINAGITFAGTTAAIALTVSTISKLTIAVRGLMASMGPAGWLITGISVLGGLIAGVNSLTEQANEITLESIDAKNKEIQSFDQSIQRYDELKSKLQLSNDELGRFLDINSEIAKTTDSSIIAKLKDEQDKLREQSGLTNDEMTEFLQLNKDIADKVPETNRTITDQGNAFINNTDAAKNYNNEQRKMIQLQLEAKLAQAEADRSGLLQKEKDLLKDINNLEVDRKNASEKVEEQKQKLYELEQQQQMYRERGDEISAANLGNMITGEKNKLTTLQEQVAKVYEEIVAKQENLNKTREQLNQEEKVKQKLVDIMLQQSGINSKKGEELKTIDSQIAKLEQAKKKLQETTPTARKNTDEYKEQVNKIQEQINKLNSTKTKIEEIIGSSRTLNTVLGKTIIKTVKVNIQGKEYNLGSNGHSVIIPGVNYHTGGIVGREPLPKLHTGGLAAKFANAPLHNEIDVRLLRNEMVLTEAQQANLMRMIDVGYNPRIKQENEQNDHVIQHITHITVEGNIDQDLYNEIMNKQYNEATNRMIVSGVRPR
ncbi:phage tail tape measure protein [Heyndrickxia oleronia]|uniref:phage tail tape measure protein n=1 Tax=Heyndrickxia oleronia TaxID=38875 RepID=UPI001C0ED0F4|nr:phage tail tape measure protein [Heyndrickxia oleronia]MBU5214960.1 phage tail tape measure protein [Heyndrickxia oleronia]